MEDLLLWSKTQLNEFKTSVEPVALLPVIETCKQLLQLNSEAKNISYQQTIEPTDMANTDIYFLQTIYPESFAKCDQSVSAKRNQLKYLPAREQLPHPIYKKRRHSVYPGTVPASYFQ